MKITSELQAIKYGGCLGLSKYVLVNVPAVAVRKDKREKKEVFPKAVLRSKQRKGNKVVSRLKRAALFYDESVQEPMLENNDDIYMLATNLTVFTEQELTNLLAYDERKAQQEMLENKVADQRYDLVLDCELVFPDEEEEA